PFATIPTPPGAAPPQSPPQRHRASKQPTTSHRCLSFIGRLRGAATPGMEQMITPTISLRARPAFAAALLAATSLIPAAFAQPAPPNLRDGTVTKGEVSSGSLLLQSSQPGRYVEAPL